MLYSVISALYGAAITWVGRFLLVPLWGCCVCPCWKVSGVFVSAWWVSLLLTLLVLFIYSNPYKRTHVNYFVCYLLVALLLLDVLTSNILKEFLVKKKEKQNTNKYCSFQ